jgi:hypothetical protein
LGISCDSAISAAICFKVTTPPDAFAALAFFFTGAFDFAAFF